MLSENERRDGNAHQRRGTGTRALIDETWPNVVNALVLVTCFRFHTALGERKQAKNTRKGKTKDPCACACDCVHACVEAVFTMK